MVNKVDIGVVSRLQRFVKEEEYDTDALCQDIEGEYQESNTAKQVNNQECWQQIQNFLSTAKRMFFMFAVLCHSHYKY